MTVERFIRNKFLFLISLSSIAIAFSFLWSYKNGNLDFYVHEDGFFESLTAISFFLSGVIFLVLYIKDHEGNKLFSLKINHNLFFLLLSLLFLFASGEEISWGQRIFHFQTPENLIALNRQQEFNIHNLSIFHGVKSSGEPKTGISLWLSMGRLFSLFWLMFCIAIPLFSLLSTKFSRLIGNLHLPLVPLWLGIMFAFNHLISKYLETLNTSEIYLKGVVEIKESNFAFLFLLVALYFFKIARQNREIAIN